MSISGKSVYPQRNLLLIDGAAPFFSPFIDGKRKNWSKAPLSELLENGILPEERRVQIYQQLEIHCQKVSAIGYNAITFDDLTHLTLFDFYPDNLNQTYRDQLRNCKSLRSISVWCQTDGWSHFDRLSFLDNSSPWNELNSIAALELFTSEKNAEGILDEFCQQSYPQDYSQLVETIKLIDHLIDNLWYFSPFSKRTIGF